MLVKVLPGKVVVERILGGGAVDPAIGPNFA